MENKYLRRPLFEACVETLEQAVEAQRCGADRIELCAHLEAGGLTPPKPLIHRVKEFLHIPVRAIIRPRAGGFVYDETETAAMERSIEFCREAGLDGVVLGCLHKDGRVDMEKTGRLAALALPLKVTFHKAIDETPDPLAALHDLKTIPGISAVLSSGGAATALEGQAVLRQMIEAAGERLVIIAAGSITLNNFEEVHAAIRAREYHGRRIVF